MRPLTREIVAEAYPSRRLLQIRHGALRLALLPLWELDDQKRLVLVWGRDPSDVWATTVGSLAGASVVPKEPLQVEPLVAGARYVNPVRRVELLALAARFEFSVRFAYRGGRGKKPREVRGLAIRERLFQGAQLSALGDDHPRGARVPREAFRSYRVDKVEWVELPPELQGGVSLGWGPEGYFVEGE